jgi:spermidine synthase
VELRPTERPAAFVLAVDGRDQSYVDLEQPTRLEFDYLRRMADVIDAYGEPGAPLRVVHLGGGAMTLPRYVAHTRPRSAQVVLEPDVDMIELVRRRLPLPRRSGIKVRPLDGRSGLAALRDASVDLAVVDAFCGGRVPGELVTTQCAAAYDRVLDDGGLLLINLVDSAPFAWTRRVVAAVRTVLPAQALSAEPATLRGRRAGNLLLVAGRAVIPDASRRTRAATGSAPYRIVDGTRVRDSFGGGTPFTDADTAPSPATS